MKVKTYNPDVLRKQYLDENLTITEIAKIHQCNYVTIQKNIKKFNIKKEYPLYLNKDWLYNEFIVLNKNAIEIANMFCCSVSVIQHHINKFGFKKNKIFEDKELLDYHYRVLNKSQSEIMSEFKIGRNSLVKALKKFNITRNDSELIDFNNRVVKKRIYSKIKTGSIKTLEQKTLPQISKDLNIPVLTLQRYFKNKEKITENELIFFVNAYKNRHTIIENKIKNELNIEIYDKFFDLKKYSCLKYKPDFKINNTIALNVDGLFWHSELCKDNYYHFKMRKDYEDLGLRIFQFRENEVYQKLPIIKSIINNVLNKTETKIGARKTKIRKPKFKDVVSFLNNNHIMGYKKAKHIGLYYNDDLVFVMSFNIIKNEETFIKIERFCSKINTNIIGGFSKLLKEIENNIPNLPIYCWVDLRYGTGNFLLNNGFELIKDELNWEWTDKKNTYSKLEYQNYNISKDVCWIKIYDAGQRLYKLNKKGD